MITVLKYQRYLGSDRKRGRRLGKPRLLSRFLTLAQYRWYFKTVTMYFIYICSSKIYSRTKGLLKRLHYYNECVYCTEIDTPNNRQNSMIGDHNISYCPSSHTIVEINWRVSYRNLFSSQIPFWWPIHLVFWMIF